MELDYCRCLVPIRTTFFFMKFFISKIKKYINQFKSTLVKASESQLQQTGGCFPLGDRCYLMVFLALGQWKLIACSVSRFQKDFFFCISHRMLALCTYGTKPSPRKRTKPSSRYTMDSHHLNLFIVLIVNQSLQGFFAGVSVHTTRLVSGHLTKNKSLKPIVAI